MTDQRIVSVEEAVKKYARTLAKTAYAYTGCIHDAEDVAQDCFIALMQSGRSFSDESHLKAWLIRVAVNKSKNLLKSSSRSKRAALTEDIAAVCETDSVLSAVMTLDKKYRIPIHLFYYEGYSINEIAELTGERPTTIGSRLDRARDKLKAIIGGEER